MMVPGKRFIPVGAGEGLCRVGTLVSPWLEAEDSWGQDEGDASVPTPLRATPAPTN